MNRFAMLCACACLLGCGAQVQAPSATGNSWPLAGTWWRLTELAGGRIADPGSRPASHLILQAADRRASGFSGCNRFAGGYTLEGAGLRFQPLAGTRMACADGMAQEQAFLQSLAATAAWRIEGERLQLLAADGRPVAAFAAGSTRYACEGGTAVLVHATPREAVLSLDDRVFTLRGARGASGMRYVTEQGRSSGYSLEWLANGDEGLLVEAPLSDSRSMADVRTVTRCASR